MKWKPAVSALVISLGLLTGTSQAQDSKVVWAKASDPAYRMDYPQNWELNKTQGKGISLMAKAPTDKAGDKFHENISVIVQEFKAGETALSLGENSIKEIVSLIDGAKLLESEYVTEGEEPYYKGVYTCVQYGIELRYEQRYFAKGSDAYILVTACELSDYEKYAPIYNRMFESFTFVK